MSDKRIRVEDVYPVTTIKYPDRRGELTVVMYEHIKDYTPPVKMRALEEFMKGQTAVSEGYYYGDVEKWLATRDEHDEKDSNRL